MTKNAVFGIDLGTTNSCIARYADGSFDVIPIDGQKTMPSIVAWDGRNWLVGKRAANHGMAHPEESIRSVKRHMGQPDIALRAGTQSSTPVAVSAIILAYLKDAASLACGHPVSDVVITVPAWFNEPQRRATLTAGEQAGLNVLRIVNEPTAAALAYDLAKESSTKERAAGETWMVFDLGGGTFDVSILSVSGGFKEVRASCGNTFLGGDDFDHRIVLHLLDQIKDRYGADLSEHKLAMAQLRHVAETAKIELSTYPEVKIREFIATGDGKPLELNVTFTRERFNVMLNDYVDSMIVKAKQALDEAKVDAADLSRLLLVGGSTRIPLVRARVAAEFGLEPDAYVDPDLSVALGACVQAALDKGLTCSQIVVDVSPHTLGVAALGEADMRRISEAMFMSTNDDDEEDSSAPKYPLTFVPLIRRNSRLPAKFVEEFFTAHDDQRMVEVAVFQGESSCTRDNTFISSFTVPLSPMPAGASVFIGFEYDPSGMVKVSVADQGQGAAIKTHAIRLNQPGKVESGTALIEATADRDVTNFLVEKVTTRLTGATAKNAPIEALLAEYKTVLKGGDDSRLDDIEERLYSWLESEPLVRSEPIWRAAPERSLE